jgi:peptide/nickel transport system substrate-binding protein
MRRLSHELSARHLIAAAGVLVLSLTACTRDTPVSSGGALVIATPADVDALLPPFVVTSTGRAVVDNIFERLAEAPPGDTVVTTSDAGWQPRLAKTWTWSADSLSVAFALDPAARFHDEIPVRARDVVFSFRLLRDPAVGSAAASLVANVDSITARDSLTAVAWFKRRTAERFYDVAYQLWVMPAHVLDTIPSAALRTHPAARRPVGSGRFRFAAWQPGEFLELVADSTHPRGRPGFDRVRWTVAPDPAAAVLRVTSGEADVLDNVRGPMMRDLSVSPDVQVVQYRSRQIGTLLLRVGGVVAPHPVLGDVRVRRAVTHALDGAAIARNVFDTLGRPATGPLPGGAAAARWPYDTTAANALLDSAGWRRGADGMRVRNGRALGFSILVPATSRPRVQIATLVQEALRRVGIAVTVEQADMPAFVARLGSRRFDSAIQVFSSDPSPFGLREQWGRAAATSPGGANFTGWTNAQFDAQLDSAEVASAQDAPALVARAVATLLNDAPGVFLVQPRVAIALRRGVKPVGLRDDGWWTFLADWTRDPAVRAAPR